MTRLAHGHTRLVNGKQVKSPTYHSWKSMNDRCKLSTHKWWNAYGGRGITVCEDWRNGRPGAFGRFLAYLHESGIGERPSKLMTLDRLRVDENYEPGNIKWSDKVEQRANQRPARTYTPEPRESEFPDNESTYLGG